MKCSQIVRVKFALHVANIWIPTRLKRPYSNLKVHNLSGFNLRIATNGLNSWNIN